MTEPSASSHDEVISQRESAIGTATSGTLLARLHPSTIEPYCKK